MKIAFNPSTVAALITPPNNKDITFDLRGRNIFARGVKFCGTDTNTWRDIKINNVSIGSNTLDLRNGSNTTLTNTNGVVTINSTWRPVVDNLTSDSTTSSLSANLGRVLAGLISTLSTNISNLYALRDGSNATGRWRGGLACLDVRDTNYTPHDLNTGLELLFLRNNTNNLKDGGEYNGVFSFRQWASGSDWSGGKAHLLSFTDNGNIWHRTSSGDDSWGTWKKLAYSTDIPSSLKNPYSLTTFGVVYDGSSAKTVTTSNFISLVNEATAIVTDGTMFITSYASNSGFADTNAVNVPYKRKAIHLWEYIKMKTDSLYATKSHNHDDRYLKLTGGIMTGTINRSSGGSTISGRDHAIIRLTYAPGGSSWNPIACVDTETGTWTLGHLSSGDSDTNFHFCFSTNTDYNAGNNNGNYVTLRNKVGTIALLSDIPNKNSWNYDDRYVKKTGDTMSGVFKAKANQYNDGYDGAINMNNSDIYGLNSIYTADRSDAQAEGIHFWRDSTHVDTLRMVDGKLLFTPNRPLGGSGTEQTVLHTGNSHIKGSIITINGSSLTPLTSLPSHTHSWTSITDKLVAGNEFNIVNAGFNAGMWFNYVPINDRSKTATITGYHFGNGAQGYASVLASGFVKTGSSSSYVLLGDGGHQTISSLSVNHALFADYIRKNELPTPANNTVKAYKDSLVKFFTNYPNGIGANVSVSTSIINQWSNDAATYYDSSNYSVIKISGSYNGTTYGQFLLSSYNLSQVGIVGRNNSQWSKIKWLAFEDQIPTNNNQLTNGAGYITSAGSCAYASKAGSVAWSNVTGKPTIPNPTNYYWANIKVSASSNTQTQPSVNTIYANNWFRSQGNSGWFSESYGGGIYMVDTSWIRTYNGKGFYCDSLIYSSNSIRMSNICLQNNNEINNDANGILHLNYRNTGNITLCNGGGAVTIGTTSTDIGGNKLYVNGSEFINGASNVKDHVFANGFRHRSHNSNDSVLLAGGGYSQGVPVRYWAIYSMYIGNSSTDITYAKRSGNYNFITSKVWESEGTARFDISFPSGYNKNNTLIFGNGDHRTSSSWKTPVYVTITTSTGFGSESQIRVMISDDASLNTGFANIYFMCMS